MEKLSLELLENILAHLVVEELSMTERFATLTPESKQTILNARLVCRSFLRSKALRQQFVPIIAQTPFIRIGDTVPGLDEFSQSEYAAELNTLSFSGIYKEPNPATAVSAGPFYEAIRSIPVLLPILKRLSNVRHLRYYPVTARYIHGSWQDSGDDWPPVEYNWTEPVDDPTMKVFRGEAAVNPESSVFRWLPTAFSAAKLTLESLEMPLMGNVASWCAMETELSPNFVSNLKRCSFNYTSRRGRCLFPLELLQASNLEFLELAVSRGQYQRSWLLTTHEVIPQQLMWDNNGELVRLPNLKEFRFQTDNSYRLNSIQLVNALAVFPNLTKLGFANIRLADEDGWETVLKTLQSKSEKLEGLWLVNPGYAMEVGPHAD
ncbi:hypothetical protein P154DRAFT_611237 [Amniculicola lignicola CBS 123094]|uniref:F-box domain-containing protein n=1 Tax=Amniculicola lignicola CBS 123094 TaxID=1392246 RepID=A0A6A5WCH6_9PLEO|nr:hypothetical protein P154DRAFT_611237 [Amniculicola lignicola CBS 123094]